MASDKVHTITDGNFDETINGGKPVQGWILTVLCAASMAAILYVLAEALPKWLRALRGPGEGAARLPAWGANRVAFREKVPGAAVRMVV